MAPLFYVTVVALLANAAVGSPVSVMRNSGENVARAGNSQPHSPPQPFGRPQPYGQYRGPSRRDMASARAQWRADTATVSHFLSIAESLSSADIQAAAETALSAENNELLHKKMMDCKFLDNGSPNLVIQQASNVLVEQGTFQFVVDGLQKFVNEGANMSPEEVSATIQAMNKDRCGPVLTSIDTYFAEAGKYLQDRYPVTAVRPNNCPTET